MWGEYRNKQSINQSAALVWGEYRNKQTINQSAVLEWGEYRNNPFPWGLDMIEWSEKSEKLQLCAGKVFTLGISILFLV